MADPHAQHGFRVRVDWGPRGAETVGRGSAIVAVVDVLSFTTSLTIAVDLGIEVYPYRFHDDRAAAYAREHKAVLAVGRALGKQPGQVSLSPASIRRACGVTRLVLPSPNGSTISQHLAAQGSTVIGVSLRNARAAATWTAERVRANSDAVVTVIASGERWPDGSLRPAIEDLWGAGSFLSGLAEHGMAPLSPEAQAAVALYRHDADRLPGLLPDCASGRELVSHGYPEDVQAALEVDASQLVPLLTKDIFRSAT